MLTLTTPTAQHIKAAETLYLESFPPEERRPWQMILSPESQYGPKLQLIIVDDQFAGMVTTWHFDQFIYIEHLAVNPKVRGRGIGAELLSVLSAQVGKPIVLEVELPNEAEPMTIRRINFYTRNGFTLLDYDYIQPPYSPELSEVPLKLMTTEPALDPKLITRTLHTQVYGIK